MDASIYLHNMESSNIAMWPIYTDITCSGCGKVQTLVMYEIDNCCIRCKHTEKFPIFVIDKAPIVFSTREETDNVRDIMESTIIASQMLEYERPMYNVLLVGQPCISISFESRANNKLMRIVFFMDGHAKFKKVSLRVGKYGNGDWDVQINEKNVLSALNQIKNFL